MKDYLLYIAEVILGVLIIYAVLALVYTLLLNSKAKADAGYHAGIPFEWRIVDGDTISTTNRPRRYYRLAGFDAPEVWRPRCDKELLHGTKAKQYLKSLLDMPNITWLNTGQKDKYGRDLVYLWVGGKSISHLMIKANYGVQSNGSFKPNWCARLKAAN